MSNAFFDMILSSQLYLQLIAVLSPLIYMGLEELAEKNGAIAAKFV